MSFPDRDSFWLDTYEFVRENFNPQDAIVAPLEFSEKFDTVVDYFLIDREDNVKNFQWVILHKGQLDSLEIKFLKQTQQFLSPVYANEVFVVFANSDRLTQLDWKSNHLKSLSDYLKKLISKSHQHNNISESGFPIANCVPAVYVGNNTALVKNKYGHKMYVDTRDLSVAPHLLMDGHWEPWITKLFLTLVKPGMNVVEVGSNIGYYSLLAASRIGDKGFIHCFEANPHIYDLLTRNLDINGFIPRSKCINKAVIDRQSKIKFRVLKNYLGSSYLCFSKVHEKPSENAEIIKIQSTSLEEELGRDYHIDLLKIDAEGAEPLIIQGSVELLKYNPNIKVILEFNIGHFTPEYGEHADAEEYLGFLRNLGFKINLITEDSQYHQVSNAEIINNPKNQELLLFR